jgi:hypothetical protein
MPSLDLSAVTSQDEMNPPLPTTPKRQNLPTMTELLASTKKGKKKQYSLKNLKPKSAVSASTGIVDSSTKPTSKFCFPSPRSPTDKPYMLDPYAISVNHSALEPDLDLDLSPTKSLSSLAGSDSKDDEELAVGLDFSPSSFTPCATSTQHQNNSNEGHKEHLLMGPHSLNKNRRSGAGLSLGFGGYNSQFDIAGQVDKVDKLLEKDVDYEGWLRDPSLEREVVQVEESP